MMISFRQLVAYAMLGLGLCSASAGCRSEAKSKDDPEEMTVPVEVMEITPRSIARRLSYDADVQGSLEVKVFSQVPERIVSLPVREGDVVSKGDVIAVVRAETLSAGVSSARAALDAARAERDQLKDELARQRKLLARKIVSQAAVDQLVTRLATAEAQIRRLEAGVRQASTARGNAVIRSPISGVIGRRFVDQGDMAAPSVPICTVVQRDKVKLIIDVPEQDLADIREGMPAAVSVARYPERTFRGEVTSIFPTIDRRTRTAQIKVELDNSKHELMPGMLARVALVVERHEGVPVVPYRSLIIEMGAAGAVAHRVFVVEDATARGREVELGIVDGKQVEITSGLEMNDILVTRGQHLLEEGKKVEVVERIGADGRPKKPNREAPAEEASPGEPSDRPASAPATPQSSPKKP